MDYKTADQWRDAAMKRENGVDTSESECRRERVRQHQLQEGVVADADTLADYELYISGKMEMEEYHNYLYFKHSGASQR